MINRVAVVALAVVLWASSAQAQLVTNGVWVPMPPASNDGSTALNNKSWDEDTVGWKNITYIVGNGNEWLVDPNDHTKPARWTWKGFEFIPSIQYWGGISEFTGRHYMDYSGDAVGVGVSGTSIVARSAPLDGSPTTSVVLIRGKAGTRTYYAVAVEDLPDGPIGPREQGFTRDADFNDWIVTLYVDMTCEEITAAYLMLLAVR